MKKILIALIVIGVTNFSADAKTKKHTASNDNQNFKVCMGNGGYHICGKDDGTTTTSTNTQMQNVDEQAWNTSAAQPATLSMNTINSYEGYYKKHNIVVSDDMHKPYEGEASKQYDGPAKNEERNLNVNQTSVYLPPSSGSYTK